MTRYEAMERISKTLKDGETLEVRVSHPGKWNGADVYNVTNKAAEYVGHRWNTYGTLMSEYSSRVLGK